MTSIGALLAGLAVAAGAFGAHALRVVVPSDRLQVFETAARYQMFHGLALLFVGMHSTQAPRAGARLAGILFIAGTLLFSGSLYALALTGVRIWGAVTPFGGLAYLAGWSALAHAFWPRRA